MDLLLLSHPTFGALGIMAAVWVLVEALNASSGNEARIRFASRIVAFCIGMSWVLGGYWYVHFYGHDKALILKGPLPYAHNLVMETKEHLFFIVLILAFYLPIVAARGLHENPAARRMTIAAAGLLALTAFAVEGGGAIISFGVKAALLQHGA
ncbi:hypothetical protein [Chromobacterium alticapitis]|uniref:Copper resistance protein D domain-containing protein n=1 Tax=Chromobacterium alticapitis TaxID=2073169 RepID=A0A2S5DG49_9NEIS|nr:hypothetical protein [Chromobacterium alticapitis]POZ61997.1 hypothetical protein C2I19_10615 [Chromobacterium alticapitis]